MADDTTRETSGHDSEGIDRRTLLKAGTALAVTGGGAALAGCVGEPEGSDGEPVTRPVFEGDVTALDPELRFIVESLDYQNAHIEAQWGGE